MDALLVLKASVLLSLTLVVVRLLRAASAATRHRLWSLTFAALLALPILALALPGLDVPLPAGWAAAARLRTFFARPVESGRVAAGVTAGEPAARPRSDAAPARAETTPHDVEPAATAERRRSRPHSNAWSAAGLLAGAWVLGTGVAVSALLLSLLRVRRLARHAEELVDPEWRATADALGTRLGLRRRACLLVSPLAGTPMAAGLWRPRVFLPVSARAWHKDCRDVVLAHEIAHLAARDPGRHLAARLALACYWFHPLAWIAARQAAIAREQACDEVVLALGTRPSAYARVLLDLADSMPTRMPAFGALPMVNRSLLETRLVAILHDTAHPETRRHGVFAAIGAALLTAVVAAAQPRAPGSAAHAPPPVAALAGTAAPAEVVSLPRPMVAVAPSIAAAAAGQADVTPDSACSWDRSSGSFTGSMSTTRSGGRTVIVEQIGTRGTDRVIQKGFGEVRLCMVAEGVGDRNRAERPSQWIDQAARVTLELRRGGAVQRLHLSRASAGERRTSWQVDGVERALDAAAQQWRDRMLAVLDTTWELSSLRGEVSSLRGQISSIRGQESSLRGEISSRHGEVSSMRGRASSIRGEESSLRGRQSSIRGHESSLRGAISSERGAISSLDARRDRADDAERARLAARVGQHEAEIARIEREIREYGAAARVAALEQEIKAFDAAAKVAAIEAEIRAFDLDAKVAAIERRIKELDVAGKVAAIERQIEALDADRRGRQLEDRQKGELQQLEVATTAIR